MGALCLSSLDESNDMQYSALNIHNISMLKNFLTFLDHLIPYKSISFNAAERAKCGGFLRIANSF